MTPLMLTVRQHDAHENFATASLTTITSAYQDPVRPRLNGNRLVECENII
jgi:hypothetical protein